MSDYQPQRNREEEGDFFCRFTFGQFFALLLLEIFTLFFIFYLGARYGRQFLGLDKRPPDYRAEENVHDIKTTDDPEVTKMARELIEQAKTPELKDKLAKMLGTDQAGKVKATEEPVQIEPQKLIVKEEVVPEASPTPEGVVRVKSAEAAKYSLQLGSYPQVSEANEAIEKWKTKGYPAYMMIADIPDRGRWFRVRLGGFENRDDAQHYLEEFRTREGIEALIVLNEQ